MGSFVVSFSGGEPLLSNYLFPLLSEGNQLKINTNLLTNGSLLTEETINTLEERGLTSICIPLEGPKAKIHDHFMGSDGIFEHITKMISLLADSSCNVRVDCTLTTLNIGFIQDIIELACDLGVKRIAFLKLTMKGRAHSTIEPEPEEYVQAVLDILQYEDYDVDIDLPLLPASYYENFDGLHEKISEKSVVPCSKILSQCTVNPAGYVRACYLASENIGNVREKPLHTLWQEGTKDFWVCKGCSLRSSCESMAVLK